MPVAIASSIDDLTASSSSTCISLSFKPDFKYNTCTCLINPQTPNSASPFLCFRCKTQASSIRSHPNNLNLTPIISKFLALCFRCICFGERKIDWIGLVSMVHQQRYYHNNLKKGGEVSVSIKRGRPRLLFSLFLSLIVSLSLIWTLHPFAFLPPYSSDDQELVAPSPLCSSVSNGSMCCDRSNHRTDICFIKGDVRTQSSTSSIFLYTSSSSSSPHGHARKQVYDSQRIEKIRPYTRKWETSVMSTIEELKLVSTNKLRDSSTRKCDVHHHVPAIFFSTGGYTGNVYHEFNDGLIPLYITSQHFNKKVVFVILEYHNWWLTKYGTILSRLSDYPPVDFNGDKRTHCFPEAIVGLRIHDELTVDSQFMPGNKTITDFRNLLDLAYRPRIRDIVKQEKHMHNKAGRPKLVILSRNGSRSITNEGLLVKLAQSIGFQVQVLRPDRTTELAKIYRSLNSSDVMIGVHGAAMTHFLFMKPGSVFIQVIPLGTQWAAATYYGDPSLKLGLHYIPYPILPRESSLYANYHKDDPVLADPNSVVKKGWDFTKKIYLDNQTIEINLNRFKKRLVRAYRYSSKPYFPTRVAAQ